MATARGLTSYKKKDGVLQLAKETVTWTPSAPTANASASVIIPVASIKNLQATPPTNPKVMLKILVTKDDNDASLDAPESYVFQFSSPSAARAEADAMKEALTAAIQAIKNASGTGTPRQSAPAKLGEMWSNQRLVADTDLQQSLLKSDSALSRTFTDAVLQGHITASQFWSTRTHLLRAHAIERMQSRGPYNVLAAIKITTSERMQLSRDQIADIFDQHPLVKTIYDENVPRLLQEKKFWERFFGTRLFKKLKGEKILTTDPTDPIFDRYIHYDEDDNSRKRRRVDHVPLTLDLEGNEQDAKRGGNQPDITMRPSKAANVPIIKTLNSLSQKLLDVVPPADVEGDDPDAYYTAEQRLHDLADDEEEERIILNIRDQRAFFSNDLDKKGADKYAHIDPTQAYAYIRRSLGDTDLNLAAKVSPDRASGRSRLANATAQITAAVGDRSSQLIGPSTAVNSSMDALPIKIADAVKLVHGTTNEFLHHFWLAFLSGDEKRAKDINGMINSLKNSKGRIEAIAKDAEDERELEKARRKKMLKEEYDRTGIKPKKKDMEVGGGRKVVEELLKPTVVAVETALSKYQLALDEAEKSSATTAAAANGV